MKRCTTCQVEKDVSEFYREGTGPGRSPRLKSSCKDCHKERVRATSKTPQGRAYTRRRYHATGAALQKAARARLREHRFFKWRAQLWSRRFKVHVSATQLAVLWIRQRGRCPLSGRRLDRRAHLDHVIHVARGGAHTIENLRWLDPNVNEARRALSDDEFIALCCDVATKNR